MSVENQPNFVIFPGNGSDVPYSIPFTYTKRGNLIPIKAYRIDKTTTEEIDPKTGLPEEKVVWNRTLLRNGIDYTLSNSFIITAENSDQLIERPYNQLTTHSNAHIPNTPDDWSVPNGSWIIIVREQEKEQTTVLNAKIIERALDKIVRMIQDLSSVALKTENNMMNPSLNLQGGEPGALVTIDVIHANEVKFKIITKNDLIAEVIMAIIDDSKTGLKTTYSSVKIENRFGEERVITDQAIKYAVNNIAAYIVQDEENGDEYTSLQYTWSSAKLANERTKIFDEIFLEQANRISADADLQIQIDALDKRSTLNVVNGHDLSPNGFAPKITNTDARPSLANRVAQLIDESEIIRSMIEFDNEGVPHLIEKGFYTKEPALTHWRVSGSSVPMDFEEFVEIESGVIPTSIVTYGANDYPSYELHVAKDIDFNLYGVATKYVSEDLLGDGNYNWIYRGIINTSYDDTDLQDRVNEIERILPADTTTIDEVLSDNSVPVEKLDISTQQALENIKAANLPMFSIIASERADLATESTSFVPLFDNLNRTYQRQNFPAFYDKLKAMKDRAQTPIVENIVYDNSTNHGTVLTISVYRDNISKIGFISNADRQLMAERNVKNIPYFTFYADQIMFPTVQCYLKGDKGTGTDYQQDQTQLIRGEAGHLVNKEGFFSGVFQKSNNRSGGKSDGPYGEMHLVLDTSTEVRTGENTEVNSKQVYYYMVVAGHEEEGIANIPAVDADITPPLFKKIYSSKPLNVGENTMWRKAGEEISFAAYPDNDSVTPAVKGAGTRLRESIQRALENDLTPIEQPVPEAKFDPVEGIWYCLYNQFIDTHEYLFAIDSWTAPTKCILGGRGVAETGSKLYYCFASAMKLVDLPVNVEEYLKGIQSQLDFLSSEFDNVRYVEVDVNQIYNSANENLSLSTQTIDLSAFGLTTADLEKGIINVEVFPIAKTAQEGYKIGDVFNRWMMNTGNDGRWNWTRPSIKEIKGTTVALMGCGSTNCFTFKNKLTMNWVYWGKSARIANVDFKARLYYSSATSAAKPLKYEPIGAFTSFNDVPEPTGYQFATVWNQSKQSQDTYYSYLDADSTWKWKFMGTAAVNKVIERIVEWDKPTVLLDINNAAIPNNITIEEDGYYLLRLLTASVSDKSIILVRKGVPTPLLHTAVVHTTVSGGFDLSKGDILQFSGTLNTGWGVIITKFPYANTIERTMKFEPIGMFNTISDLPIPDGYQFASVRDDGAGHMIMAYSKSVSDGTWEWEYLHYPNNEAVVDYEWDLPNSFNVLQYQTGGIYVPSDCEGFNLISAMNQQSDSNYCKVYDENGKFLFNATCGNNYGTDTAFFNYKLKAGWRVRIFITGFAPMNINWFNNESVMGTEYTTNSFVWFYTSRKKLTTTQIPVPANDGSDDGKIVMVKNGKYEVSTVGPSKIDLHIDAVNGDDLNSGLEPAKAIKTADKLIEKLYSYGSFSVNVKMMSDVMIEKAMVIVNSNPSLSIDSYDGTKYFFVSKNITTPISNYFEFNDLAKLKLVNVGFKANDTGKIDSVILSIKNTCLSIGDLAVSNKNTTTASYYLSACNFVKSQVITDSLSRIEVTGVNFGLQFIECGTTYLYSTNVFTLFRRGLLANATDLWVKQYPVGAWITPATASNNGSIYTGNMRSRVFSYKSLDLMPITAANGCTKVLQFYHSDLVDDNIRIDYAMPNGRIGYLKLSIPKGNANPIFVDIIENRESATQFKFVINNNNGLIGIWLQSSVATEINQIKVYVTSTQVIQFQNDYLSSLPGTIYPTVEKEL